MILKGYAQWGTDVVSHLHGMFAFVIAERDTGRVVLARDRLGIKPLYLAETPARLRFASTLPALLRGRRGRHLASTRSRCTTTSAGTPSSRRRGRS